MSGSPSTLNRDWYHDVPLVEGDADPLGAVLACPGRVDGGHHAVDEGVHVGPGGEEAAPVTVELLVVGVHRDVVDDVPGVLEHLGLP